MTDNFFLEFITYIALIIIAISTYKKWYNKKYRIENIQEANKPTKLNQNYLYKVFIDRANVRPSSYIFVFSAFIAMFALIMLYMLNWMNPILKLDELEQVTGTVKKINTPHKGFKTLTLQLDNKKERNFKLVSIAKKNGDQIVLNKRITVYYQHKYSPNGYIDFIYEIKLNNKFIKNYMDFAYVNFIEGRKNSIGYMKFCSYVIVFSVFFLWFINRRELPIHIRNRVKRLEKNEK